ncbi:MAG: DNA adenine methylase [Nitrosomonas sp.]|nr:DNA adenine methylase [Nitrosomonas sp.]MBP7113424.1 DNA adenine methylase [Nitrosomonas sp.]
MKFDTPLRYPGDKARLADFFKMVFRHNALLDGHYVEPYAGGAGIALNLLTQGYVSCIHLNDLSPAVFAFWHSVINQPEELCRAIHDVKITKEEWLKQEAILNTPADHSLLEVGFSNFFLNRTNRPGVLWKNAFREIKQNELWAVDPRFNKNELIRRIEWIAMFRPRIRLYNLDAEEFIKSVLPTLPSKTLVYLDPPYYVKGWWPYEGDYSHDDHANIAKLVKEQIDQYWMVSYDNVPEAIEMYKGYPSIVYDMKQRARDSYIGTEVMFFSNRLIIPDVDNPVDLKAA